MRDFVNDQFPITFRPLNITANGDTEFGFEGNEFELGLTINWGFFAYGDGDYIIRVETSDDGGATGTPVDQDKHVIIPQLDLVEGFDPTSIIGIGATGQIFEFGIKEWPTPDMRIKITASNVTSGADVFVIVTGYGQRKPTTKTHFI